ncbi:hypothetical protein [Jannaschia sp. CCS1]|uniref:hypothetical protein n=1 Tax=Jannaschia sp. (strain CCS1) TaxID=290400 RepID=UPI00006BFFFE|nr:hypothetical protein [Jannaschia sp. CCS1]ABD54599.1 hypothetical protein Jann_1682 [Jannaschia sp. CCS1]
MTKRTPAVRPFYPVVIAAATVIFVQPVLAQMSLDPACIYQEGSQASCTHAVACIGGDTLFVGGTVGWDEGVLTGDLSNGASCTGIWNNANQLVNFTCDDGQTGIVRYTLFDGSTGTAIGAGETIAGRPIEAWSGQNIVDFVERETGRVTLQCGVEELLLG